MVNRTHAAFTDLAINQAATQQTAQQHVTADRFCSTADDMTFRNIETGLTLRTYLRLVVWLYRRKAVTTNRASDMATGNTTSTNRLTDR